MLFPACLELRVAPSLSAREDRQNVCKKLQVNLIDPCGKTACTMFIILHSLGLVLVQPCRAGTSKTVFAVSFHFLQILPPSNVRVKK